MKDKFEMKFGARQSCKSLIDAAKVLAFIKSLEPNKTYGIVYGDGVIILLKDELISKSKIKKILTDKIWNRQFELQQEYKDFEDDIELNILQDLRQELLEN